MTSKQIKERMENELKKTSVKFEAAMAIRAILDQAAKDYKAADGEPDDDDLENGIIELVQEEV
jgi:hypothetical protein